jgi:hypothetical protein
MNIAAAKVGSKLTPVPFTFGQIVMAHLPNMTLEAIKKRNAPEAYAVRSLSLDYLPPKEAMNEESLEAMDEVVLFSDAEFPLLQSFCHCYRWLGKCFNSRKTWWRDRKR